MNMKIEHGDLLALAKSGKFDVIIHGCNCFCSMGAGVAKQIAQQFPEAELADKSTFYGDRSKMGECVMVEIGDITVINAYTQFGYGGKSKNVDYKALTKCFQAIKHGLGGKKLRFAYPMIGAGLGKGDFRIISKIIDRELKGEDHTLVKYKK